MDIAASYNDGHVARSRPVTLRIDADSLVIVDTDGASVDRWPLIEVHFVDRPGSGQPARLRCRFDRDDRLTLVNESDAGFFAGHCPNLRRTTPGLSRSWRQVVVWGLGAVVSIALLVTVLIPTLADQIAFALPQSIERKLGERTAEQIIRYLSWLEDDKTPDTMVCNGEAGRAALVTLAARLSAGLDQPIELHLQVVDSDLVNAATLPGGYILVFRGLVDFVENADELAGVLAHEIGHVAGRHPTILALRNTATSFLFGLLVGDVGGGTVIAGLGQFMLGAAYGRDAEREADALAIRLMDGAGLDGTRLASFLRRVSKAEDAGSDIPAFLSTHPAPAERVDWIVSHAKKGKRAFDATHWSAIKAICP